MSLINREAAIKVVEVWGEQGPKEIHWKVVKALLEGMPEVDAVPICWLENLRDRIVINAMGKCKDVEGIDITDARCVNRTLELIREGMKDAD